MYTLERERIDHEKKNKSIIYGIRYVLYAAYNFSYVMAADSENTSSKMEEKFDGKFIVRRELHLIHLIVNIEVLVLIFPVIM